MSTEFQIGEQLYLSLALNSDRIKQTSCNKVEQLLT